MNFDLFAVAPPWLVSWITPMWLIGVGALLGLAVLGAFWGILLAFCRAVRKLNASRIASSRDPILPRVSVLDRQIPMVLGEGVLYPILFVVAAVALIGIAGTFAVRQPSAMLQSIPRLPFAGQRVITADIPADAGEEQHSVDVRFRGNELQKLQIEATELVQLRDALSEAESHGDPLEVGPGQPYGWSKEDGGTPFEGDYVNNFYVTNLGKGEAAVTITLAVGPAFPQVMVVPMTAVAVVCLVLIYFLQAWGCPKISAIALATTKSEIAQPMFAIVIALGIFLIVLFQFLPYNTFGEDIKMLKDSGLTLILVLGIIQGIWAASTSVSEEIDGRTALTVLSKPIGRRHFILGKLLGIIWTVALLFVFLGLVFLMVVAYKPVYDAREMGAETPDWLVTHMEVVRTVPGLVLAFFDTVVLASLSVAISTRLPMLANFVICFSIYVLGHITPLIVQSEIEFAPVVFVGQLIATILPVLDHFNIQAAVAAGVQVPYQYLGMSLVYCLIYSTIAVLLALALFEDRDLA